MKIKVEFSAQMPDLGETTVTREQIDEWLLYQLGARGGIDMHNPLHDWDIEAYSASVEWAEA